MSRRNRIRRKNRLEINTNPTPRRIDFLLPPQINPVVVRVRNPYNDSPGYRPSRDLRTIDPGIHMQRLRRLHIMSDIRHNSIDPTGIKYDYRRDYIGRDELVTLPSDHPVCRRRAERKQVMFAIHKTGKGGSQKPPKMPRIMLKCSK